MNSAGQEKINNNDDFAPMTSQMKQFELTKFLLNNLQNYNLKPTTKLVLLYLTDCYNPRKADVFPKQKTIAEKMGISEASVIRAIAELHKEGLIISERKYSNRYKFTNKILAKSAKNFIVDKMQVVKPQNETEKLAKCELHEHEQKKEQEKEQPVEIKSHKDEDFEKIRLFAVKKGAKNPIAYAKAIIRSGNDKEILDNIEKEQKRQKWAEKQHIERMKQVEMDKRLSCPPPAQWIELKAKLLQNCT